MTETKTIDGTEYTPVAWPAVREGDVLMHENGDRLSVLGFESVHIRTTAGLNTLGEYRDSGFTPHRPVPSLDAVPDTPGPYLDKDGVAVVRVSDGGRYPWGVTLPDCIERWSDEEMRHRAPFTRLVPMPSSDAVMEVVQRAEPMCMRERITDAVMALLRGGDDE